MDRLIKLVKVFDFSKIITNSKVGQLQTGVGFGEIALNTSAPRAATIRCMGHLLAIDLDRYQSPMHWFLYPSLP